MWRWVAIAGGGWANLVACLRVLQCFAGNAAGNGVALRQEQQGQQLTRKMGTTPPPDSREASATLAKEGWVTLRCGGRPWRLMPPHCQKVPETFKEFLSQGGNVRCGDYGGDVACCNSRCHLVAWKHAFQMALASLMEMLLDGGDGGVETMTVNGRR